MQATTIKRFNTIRSHRRLLLAIPLLIASLPAPALSATTHQPAPVFIDVRSAFAVSGTSVSPRSYDEVLIPLRKAQAETARLEAVRREEEAQAARQAQQAAEAAQRQAVASTAAVYGQPADFYKAFIYNKESGNNPGSINANSGACGLGQALPCSKMPCSLSDYACQDAFFTNYCLSRYGSWQGAYEFWLAHRWW